MKMPKLLVTATAIFSVAVFLFHLGIVCASLLKLNRTVWDIYKYLGDLFDIVCLGVYGLSFVISRVVWFLADAPLSRKFLYSGLLFPVYLLISFIVCVVVCYIYSVGIA